MALQGGTRRSDRPRGSLVRSGGACDTHAELSGPALLNGPLSRIQFGSVQRDFLPMPGKKKFPARLFRRLHSTRYWADESSSYRAPLQRARSSPRWRGETAFRIRFETTRYQQEPMTLDSARNAAFCARTERRLADQLYLSMVSVNARTHRAESASYLSKQWSRQWTGWECFEQGGELCHQNSVV